MSDQTPEQRAKAIYDMVQESLWHIDAIPAIAQALRDAEDAAYERAALLMEAGYELAGGLMSHPSAAVAIRSLRSTPSTGDKT